MKYGLALFCLLGTVLALGGNPLHIGLFQGRVWTSAQLILPAGGTCTCEGKATDYPPGTTLRMEASPEGIRIHSPSAVAGPCTLVKVSGPGGARIVPAGQKDNGRIYGGEILARAAGGGLRLINRIELEHYVPGVIEAEAGSNHEMEYYKVQAIISRTYAMNNLRRHEAEGFNLCDATHCQVYHGKARRVKEAQTATEATEDVVIVDDGINLITAAFHSNCGGHTLNAEHVWSKPLSYCIGRPDTFCLVMPHSNWEKKMPVQEWRNYLASKRPAQADSLLAEGMAYFPQGKERYFVDQEYRIPMHTIRSDLKLRSAFFSVQSDGEQVTFIGQGFGHGVGLCQEGAMRMAQLGHASEDIIHYYYSGVHLVPLRFLWFFRAD